jgi:hypothetical protein
VHLRFEASRDTATHLATQRVTAGSRPLVGESGNATRDCWFSPSRCESESGCLLPGLLGLAFATPTPTYPAPNMEAFGAVEPIRVPPASPAASSSQANASATPKRTSPRLQELLLRPPTPHQIERLEQEELAKRSPARPRSAPVQPPRRLRSNTQKRRAEQKRQRKSPHDEESGEPGGGSNATSNEADDVEQENPEGESEDRDGDDDGDEAYTAGETASSAAGDDDDDVDDDQTQVGAAPSLVQVCDEPVVPPPMKEIHEDWAAWKLYKAAYSRSTFQVLSVLNVIKVDKRNKLIDNLATPQPHVPAEVGPYERVYICTHGSKPRRRTKKPDTQKRVFRRINCTDCLFKFRVQNFLADDGKWRLAVKMSHNWHNHTVGPLQWKTYPVARGIKDSTTLRRATDMAGDGARPDAIYDMLLEAEENVSKRDVENFVSQHKSRLGRRDDNEATSRLLDKLMEEDPDAVVTVDETDLLETGVISVTTKHMREMFERFGELILVDCTHNTNKYVPFPVQVYARFEPHSD